MAEAFEVAALLFGGIFLLSQGMLYLGLLCVLIGLHSTDLHGLTQLVIAGSILFAAAI